METLTELNTMLAAAHRRLDALFVARDKMEQEQDIEEINGMIYQETAFISEVAAIRNNRE